MSKTYTTEVIHIANAGQDDELLLSATVKYRVSRAFAASFDCPAYGGDVEILDVTPTGTLPDGWTTDEVADLIEAGIDHSELIAAASDLDDYEADCVADFRREQMREAAR